ncbi:MAG TPA: PGPGW domain-containing protein [Thermoleophilaceae bacterium]
MAEEERHHLIVKLHERRLRHRERGLVKRAAVVVGGFFLVLFGIVMSAPGVPGPGIATILLGLTLLALEFDRAERMLERTILWAEAARERAEHSTPRQRALTAAILTLAVVALVVGALLWDIPLLPV